MSPLSNELKAMRQELWAHSEALEKLSRSVEDIRRKTSIPVKAKPATQAPRAKATKPAKEQKAAPATKRAPRKPKAS